MKLENKTVLVTGATGNLGPEVTDQLVNQGAEVAGTYLEETEKEDVEDRANQASSVSYYHVDLTEPEEVENLAETVENKHGEIDHIVGIAGGFSMGGLEDTDAEHFQKSFDIHAKTAFLTVKAFNEHLNERSSVVFFSSERAINPTQGTLAYNVGKGAVRTLTESLDAELESRVNAVAPLLIDVPANREAMPEADFSEWTAPEEVADEVIHLLTNQGVTGQIISMTGGQLEE